MPVSAERLCRQLLRTTEAPTRERLLAQAVQTPDFVAFLLDRARAALGDAPEEASALADLAVEVAGRQAAPRDQALACRTRAQALRALGSHAEAIPAFEAAANFARQSGDNGLAAQVQLGCVDSLGWLGRYDEAIALARRLEAELRVNGLETDVAKVLVNVGNLHFRRDRYAAALDCYERARPILAATGDAVTVARVQANCANILTSLNRIDEALALYTEARAAFRAAGLETAAAMVDVDEGYLRYVSGEHAAALAAYTRARQEFSARRQALETAKCDAEMADAYRELNLWPEALECYQRAIPAFARLPLDYERARAELGLAAVLAAQDRTEEAFTALDRAGSIFRAQKNGLQRAYVRLRRAALFHAAGRNAETVTEAGAAARTLANGGLHGWAAEARFLAADIALRAGPEGVGPMRGVSRAARRHARFWLLCRAERALGMYYREQSDRPRALRHFRAAVAALESARAQIASEELHVAFLRDKQAVYEDLVGLLLTEGRPRAVREALDVVERSKSRLLLERMQTALDARPASSAALSDRARLAELRAELARAYHRVHAFDESSPQRRLGFAAEAMEPLLALEQAYRVALREVELAALEAASGASGLAEVVPVGMLQQALPPEETLVEFYVVAGEVCAFVVTRERVQVRRHLAPLEEVAYAARRLRYHLHKSELLGSYVQRHAEQSHAAMRGVLQRLYALLLKPLEADLRTEQVTLVPHGVLHGLPFQAFFDGERYALDRYELAYAPSAAIWHAGVRRRDNAASQAEGVAGTEGDGNRGPLLLIGLAGPGIEQVAAEVEQLARLIPEAELFCGNQATVERFRAHAGRCRRIHLATHALFRADNPLFSGLRFADGWLLARDLYEMTLDCELATLSACRTGAAFVEPGDELFGLVRGFLASGVRSLAVSLWPADDAATAAMMGRFYTRLSQGVSRAAALRAAQRELRETYPHPYHWATFALVGER